MKIVAISDTHNRHNKLIIPECDLLIHSGDWTGEGKKSEVENFAKWLDKQVQCKNIVIVPGNHEKYFELNLNESRKWITDLAPRVNLLIDEGLNLDGINIYASPVQPWFCDWGWNRASEKLKDLGYHMYGKSFFPMPIKPHWDAIPNDTNILITHGPPYGILDTTTFANGDPKPDNLGCEDLLNRIKQLKDLDLHFFGHIHASNGQKHVDGVSYFNASICDEQYYPSNPVTVVEYEVETK